MILLKTVNFMIFEKILRIYSLLYPHQHHSSSLAEEKVPLLKNFPTEGGEGWGSGEVEMVSQLLPVLNYDIFPQLLHFGDFPNNVLSM